MTYSDLYEKVKSGEFKLPIVVKIKTPLWDEFELDTGCKAKLISIIPSKHGEDEVGLYFDFSEFEEYNKSFWKHDYYDKAGNPTEAVYEQPWYTKLNCKCDCYVNLDTEIEFEILTNPTEIITFESELYLNGDNCAVNSFVPNGAHLVGKKVKVTIEVLED